MPPIHKKGDVLQIGDRTELVLSDYGPHIVGAGEWIYIACVIGDERMQMMMAITKDSEHNVCQLLCGDIKTWLKYSVDYNPEDYYKKI